MQKTVCHLNCCFAFAKFVRFGKDVSVEGPITSSQVDLKTPQKFFFVMSVLGCFWEKRLTVLYQACFIAPETSVSRWNNMHLILFGQFKCLQIYVSFCSVYQEDYGSGRR